MRAIDKVREIVRSQPGTANSDINPLAIEYSVPDWVLTDLIREIERLHSLAGAVSPGPSGADIKRDKNATGG